MISEETGIAFIFGRSECRTLHEELDKVARELGDFQFPMLAQMHDELTRRGYVAGTSAIVALPERERT